jgi:hypothetical protein
MRLFYKLTLSSLFFLTFFTVRSQETDLLKTFINKNNIALRSIQKNSMSAPADAKNTANFKELLKFHIVSIKLYSSNKENSASSAYKVREESLRYITKNVSGSSEYFKITDEDAKLFETKTEAPSPNSYLTESELRSIETIDIKDPKLFNNFTTNIQ